MTQPRYFWSRKKSGEYWIQDRRLRNTVIAVCDFREAAALIVLTLNESVRLKETQSEPASVERPARPAILGDLYAALPWGLISCPCFPTGKSIPPSWS